MQLQPLVVSLVLIAGCGVREPSTPDAPKGGVDIDTAVDSADTAEPTVPLTATAADPMIVDPLGGSELSVTGTGFTADVTVEFAGEAAAVVEVTDTTLTLRSPPLPSGPVRLSVHRGSDEAGVEVEAWSPAELAGARVFDAAAGVATEEAKVIYEWQRLTSEISPDWRMRDGNTTTWLPSTGRYWMVAGWNGYQEPEGFSTVAPDTVYPPENTTDEVWSSPDGITWTLELEHGNGAFERRHSHNMMLWQDKLWMIGGDAHQGFYNHDVVWSADGVSWTTALGPGTADPPWPERAMQVSGVYAGKLWTGGGQDLLGDPQAYTYHNDLWSTEDGVSWTQVAADGPASDTRWGGCGVLDGFVEFLGEMWLVGCAEEREDASGHSMSNEVWSTHDGVTWTLHAEPPWVGKIWPNVVVWDDRLWILFGYTYGDPANGWTAGNANEAWYTEDGETWTSLPVDAPVPGSHAQGVAVTEEALLLAGGNYSFGFGLGADKSTWRLVPFHGVATRSWTDRGADGLVATAPDDGARPVLDEDAFGDDRPGLVFDGSTSMLAMAAEDAQGAGRTVLWVARAPALPMPWGWEETYAPLGTVVGGPDSTGYPNSSVGYSEGRVVMVSREPGAGSAGEPLWARVEGGELLQEGPGEARLCGMSHALDGTVTTWVDGAPVETTGSASYATDRSWSRIGGSLDGNSYYGPGTRFEGTLGAVVVLAEPVDAETSARIHAWARGRFGVR